jgi:hypothetical protein
MTAPTSERPDSLRYLVEHGPMEISEIDAELPVLRARIADLVTRREVLAKAVELCAPLVPKPGRMEPEE